MFLRIRCARSVRCRRTNVVKWCVRCHASSSRAWHDAQFIELTSGPTIFAACAFSRFGGAFGPAQLEDQLTAAGRVEELLITQGESHRPLGIRSEGGAESSDRLLREQDPHPPQCPAPIGPARGGREAIDAPVA